MNREEAKESLMRGAEEMFEAMGEWGEACRRGVDNASYLSSVDDGAAWIWNIVHMCCDYCVEIIDW